MFACCSSKNVESLKEVHFRVRTLKLISTFYIIAKTVEILAKTGLSFFSTERFTVELFKSKVPLIVIVAL